MSRIKYKVSKALLHRKYILEDKSASQVGEELGINRKTIDRYLRYYRIKVKSRKEIMKSRWKYYSEEERKEKTKHLKPIKKRQFVKDKVYGWKGGKTRKKDGYILVRGYGHPNTMSNGYVFEHRLIASQKLGRPLEKFEHVHHLNGIKDDNRPENLEIINGSTHNLITRLQLKVRELEKENRRLKRLIK